MPRTYRKAAKVECNGCGKMLSPQSLRWHKKDCVGPENQVRKFVIDDSQPQRFYATDGPVSSAVDHPNGDKNYCPCCGFKMARIS